MSDSVQPRRRQPIRLPHPWDSPGKNTGVGCHFLLQCMKMKSESEVAQSCLTQRPHGLQLTRLLRLWDFPGKSTGVGCHRLLHLYLLDPGNYHSILCFYELDTTERLHFHFSLSCIGEGNGNPLQCSCLENPRDGGA